jgi:hypothetical protein
MMPLEMYVSGVRMQAYTYDVCREPWGEHSQTTASVSTCGTQGQGLRPAASPTR